MNPFARLRQMVTRGKVVKATLNKTRVLVQLTGLAGETKTKVEVLSPYGFSFFPPGGADVVLLQVCGSRSHLLALNADDPALRIQDLQEGEFGFRDRNGQQIVFRSDRIEITAPDGKNIVVNGGNDLTVNITNDAAVTINGDADITVKGDLTVDVNGDADITVDGDATLDANSLALCGGTKKVVLDGDPVSDGVVHSTATKVKAA